ncbi:hypothetical protein [Bailinhaonella thermotolerans]|uniref:Uncharacterized protein n=1 Tax=Bailinhaonella thermotolerans TaxID=1070861 RepID=A0A3A4ASP7_9ACTN|nr:hypothetical protein [Bailinhaonella thermotolerans]RJL30324.1 hypothetical protein D5H75_22325 [Bailinhaonella thermotolerans]
MAHELTAFWIDAGVSGGKSAQERYGERLRAWRHGFTASDETRADGDVTANPLRFALAAWDVAVGPGADPPYVRHHPRVLSVACHRPSGTHLVLAVIELAMPPPGELPPGWHTWRREEGVGTARVAPPYDAKAALGRLELRVPILEERMPTPTASQAEGLPNLVDAQASLEAIVNELNAAAGPFLRELERDA